MTAPVHASRTRIRIVYPKPEQEIYDDNTFLMGRVQGLSRCQLRVNGQIVPVSPHGFFAWKVHLHPGMNPMKVQVFPHNQTHPAAEELFALHRMPPYASPPTLPLTVISETLQPASNIWLTKDDQLTIACLASVDAHVSVSVPGLIDTPIALEPADFKKNVPHINGFLDTRERIFSQPHWTEKRIPLHGYYQAKIPLAHHISATSSHMENLPIILHLKHGEHKLDKTLPGKLTILKAPRPAIIQQDHVITRSMPPEGNRLTPQRSSTLVWIDGLEKKWMRARLNKQEFFYLPEESIQWLPQTHSIANTVLNAINVDTINASTAQIECVMSQHPAGMCPVQIEAIVLPSGLSRLQVRFYQVESQLDFVHYPAEHPLISQVHWRQVEDATVELWIDVARPLAGYDYKIQNGNWLITIKTLPQAIRDIHVLIDPGHGGAEHGAIGLNGIFEKDLNLTVSKLLRDALTAEGFQVRMSRETNLDVSLPARQQKALEAHADIILSVHHNALPDDRDPLTAVGACTFYYHPFSKSLAESLLQGLTTDTQQSPFHVPNYGLFDDSLFITRIHQALSTLIEVGFFTNPTEFERLIDPAFQKEVAHRIATGLRQYCLAQSKI